MALSLNEAKALARLQETALPSPEAEIVHYVRMVRNRYNKCLGHSLHVIGA